MNGPVGDMSQGLSGRVEAGVHVFPVRVYYEDTDTAGIVYYANYLRFAERARTEMLRLAGIGQRALARESGIAFAVRDCAVDYRAPAHLDDLLEVRSRILELRPASSRLEQSIERDGAPLVRLDVRLACLGTDGRPARVPAAVQAALQAYCRA